MTMTYEEIEQLLQSTMEAQWIGTSTVAYDNVPQETQKYPWVRFIIIPVDSENRTLGTDPNGVTRNGILSLQIFTLLNTGSRLSQELADEFLAIFENKHLGVNSTLWFYAGETLRIGDDGNNWFQMNVTIPFQAT